MTRETLDKLRSMGMVFGPEYDVLANTLEASRKADADNVKIKNIEYKLAPVIFENYSLQKNYIIKITLSTDHFKGTVEIEIDDKIYQAFQKQTFEQNAFYCNIAIDENPFTITNPKIITRLRVDKNKIIDTMTKEVIVKNKNAETETVTEKCYCNRDLELIEFEKIIHDLKKSENANIKYTTPKLFVANNCKLKDDDKINETIVKQLNSTFLKYGITKCIHKIHFLAQIYHETDRLKTTLEYATDKKYKPYFGRGIMQLTHEINYKAYTAFYNTDSGTDNDFVKNYSVIAENLYHVFNSGGWFWKQGKILSKGNTWKPIDNSPDWLKKGNPSFPKKEYKYKYKTEKIVTYGAIDFNLIAEKDLVDVISYLVNGGENGLEERRKYVKTLKIVFKYENCNNK